MTTKHPARVVVARTDSLETQLQVLWKLKPEIKDKLSLTVAMGVAALIRESKREEALFTAELSNYQSVPATAQGVEIDFQTQIDSTSTSSESHPDAAWS